MKGIIVAAGFGTRFLPVTKTVPKEMLPLINKPCISFIVDEFVASGIKDIIIITSRRKKALDDYFDYEAELEALFLKEGKKDKLEFIAPAKANIFFVRQKEMRGTGHALLQVAPLLAGDACIVAYPDDLHFGIPPLSKQLIDVYEKTGKCVLAALYEPGDVSRYGVIDPSPDGLGVKGFIEKPAMGSEPSHNISIGRYLYTAEFFKKLAEGWEKHCMTNSPGEYYHSYALDQMIEAGKVAFKLIEGQRLDTGEPSGYLEAILEYAWMDPQYRAVVQKFISAKN